MWYLYICSNENSISKFRLRPFRVVWSIKCKCSINQRWHIFEFVYIAILWMMHGGMGSHILLFIYSPACFSNLLAAGFVRAIIGHSADSQWVFHHHQIFVFCICCTRTSPLQESGRLSAKPPTQLKLAFPAFPFSNTTSFASIALRAANRSSTSSGRLTKEKLTPWPDMYSIWKNCLILLK